MSAFGMVHQDRVAGKLVCFDRLIFKAHVPRFYPAGGGSRRSWTEKACC